MESRKTPTSFIQKFKQKGTILTISGCIIGLALLLLGGFTAEDTGDVPKDTGALNTLYYTETLEARIEELCTSIAGISEATVLLTLENGKETVYAGNSTKQVTEASSGQTFDYIFMNRNGEDEPLLITEIYPTIRGVAVVCTNGDEISVQTTIIKLLSASLGISSNRIHVAGR